MPSPAKLERALGYGIDEERRPYVVDQELLATVIKGVNLFVHERGIDASPAKQAFWAAIAYAWFRDHYNKGDVEPDSVAFRRFMEQLT